jgi:antitoxin (DNA-binding transcriptional repressor) of toxin-antitoxin stability system
MSTAYTVHYAKTNLSRLIAKACRGDEVVIARGKKRVARLVALPSVRKERIPGRLKGQIRIQPSFYKPLSKKELAAWGIE